jgi:putative endonuclease
MHTLPCVHIIASLKNGTLYTGVTSNLPKRIWEHENGIVQGFSRKYNVHRLVCFERHDSMEAAILREKQIRKWNRAWKLRLIEEQTPEWNDVHDDICQ